MQVYVNMTDVDVMKCQYTSILHMSLFVLFLSYPYSSASEESN